MFLNRLEREFLNSTVTLLLLVILVFLRLKNYLAAIFGGLIFFLMLKKFIIKSCEVCCKSKIPRHKPYRLLSPLSTPNRSWSDISMDFIVELPKSKDMTTVMLVVDRLTKMVYFIPFRLFIVFLLLQLMLMLLSRIFLSYMVSLILLFLIEDRNIHLSFGIV